MPPPPATRRRARSISLGAWSAEGRDGRAGRLASALPAALLTMGMVAAVLTGSRWHPPISTASLRRASADERVVFVAPQADVRRAAASPAAAPTTPTLPESAEPARVPARPAPLAPPARDTGSAVAPATRGEAAPTGGAAPATGAATPAASPRSAGGAPFAPSMRSARPLDPRLRAAWEDMAGQRDREIKVREDGGRLFADRRPGELTPDERNALVRAALADERARAAAAPSDGAASNITRAAGPNLLRDGLFGGGPKRAVRERDRRVHAETKQRLREVDERARTRADSIARVARAGDSSATDTPRR